jgi:hypothetical protein
MITLISLMVCMLDYDFNYLKSAHLHIRTFAHQLPGSCPAGGAHQLTVPFGLIVIVGYQYGMYNTRYPETQG